jgi:hypothetical protein
MPAHEGTEDRSSSRCNAPLPELDACLLYAFLCQSPTFLCHSSHSLNFVYERPQGAQCIACFQNTLMGIHKDSSDEDTASYFNAQMLVSETVDARHYGLSVFLCFKISRQDLCFETSPQSVQYACSSSLFERRQRQRTLSVSTRGTRTGTERSGPSTAHGKKWHMLTSRIRWDLDFLGCSVSIIHASILFGSE